MHITKELHIWILAQMSMIVIAHTNAKWLLYMLLDHWINKYKIILHYLPVLVLIKILNVYAKSSERAKNKMIILFHSFSQDSAVKTKSNNREKISACFYLTDLGSCVTVHKYDQESEF